MFAKLPSEYSSGTVSCLLCKPGDRIEAGSPLMELETKKSVFEVESEDAGTIKSIMVKVGDHVSPGEPILELE